MMAKKEQTPRTLSLQSWLQAMETKLKAEGETEAALYEKFLNWSMKEMSDTKATIKESKQTVLGVEFLDHILSSQSS